MFYLKKFNGHDEYNTFINNAEYNGPYISYCKPFQHVHYNKEYPLPKLFDILYEDINGNLSYTSEILPVSEGKTPIALCITPSNFFGAGEKARWMSLKYMNYNTPEVGSLTAQNMFWGNYNNDISTISNIDYTYKNGYIWGFITAEYNTGNTAYKIPYVIAYDNTWDLATLGNINANAVTDIDGKNKTEKILATATEQIDWRTDTAITNDSNANYAPAACCCARYHTLGTQAGDWYLGACGEQTMILTYKTKINEKLAAIAEIYPNDCISALKSDRQHWTSTEYDSEGAYHISPSTGNLGDHPKNNNGYALAMLQYQK